MTSITNEDDLSFRQAVKRVPFHLCIHFHLGTLPNRKVSVDADGQSRQKSLIETLTSLEPGRLGESPEGCRQDPCAMRESSNLDRGKIVRNLTTSCARMKLTFNHCVVVLGQMRVKPSVQDDTIQDLSPDGRGCIVIIWPLLNRADGSLLSAGVCDAHDAFRRQ